MNKKFQKILICLICIVITLSSVSAFSAESFKELNFNELKKKAQKGDLNAQFYLAVRYFRGEGVKENYKEAAKWWRKAAQLGHKGAQDRLKQLGETW